jgi:excisionase family DNA binding protein
MEEFMTASDVAELFQLSATHVYKLAKKGRIPSVRVGKALRFPRPIIEEWVRSNTQGGTVSIKDTPGSIKNTPGSTQKTTLEGASKETSIGGRKKRKKHEISAEGRARISAAQKKRWAATKGTATVTPASSALDEFATFASSAYAHTEDRPNPAQAPEPSPKTPKIKASMVDLTGKTHGRLTVLSYAGMVNGIHKWLCQCECGTQKQIGGYLWGKTFSCGCYQLEQTAKMWDAWRENAKRVAVTIEEQSVIAKPSGDLPPTIGAETCQNSRKGLIAAAVAAAKSLPLTGALSLFSKWGRKNEPTTPSVPSAVQP